MSTSQTQLAIEKHLSEIMELLGLQGESGTEALVDWLRSASLAEILEVNKSHRHGLCLNCIPGLAEKLLASAKRSDYDAHEFN